MEVYAVYWRFFPKDRNAGKWPCPRYHFNNQKMLPVNGGDYVCLFTSGQALGTDEPHAGYLVQILRVGSVRQNDGADPVYPPSEFEFMILPDPQLNLAVDRLWFDPWLRSPSSDPTTPIGLVRQAPFRLRKAAIAMVQQEVQGFRFV